MNFDEVISEIRTQMGDGDANWRMPWHGRQTVPLNVARGVPYSGINRLLLWTQYQRHGWKDAHWGTFSQWRARGEPVGAGARGTALVLPVIRQGERGEEELAGFRRFWVFNGDQVLNRNINYPDMFGHDAEDVPDVDAFVLNTRADIRAGSEMACYRLHDDFIEMPHKSAFFHTSSSTATQSYYSTLLHELIHWTRHPSRENRVVDLGDQKVSYAFEELVAELGAAFLCADFRLEDVPRKDHAQYLNSWLALIDDKPAWFWRASSLAQKAVNYLLSITPKDPEFDESSPPWFGPEPAQIDMLSPELLGTGHRRR